MQVTVPPQFANTVLDMIEQRVLTIGKTYRANGQSYQDDLEITAFRGMAQQLGFDLEIQSSADGFTITRHVYRPAE